MTTEAISDLLELTAKLMELHELNSFKIKAVASAAYKLGKTRLPLEGLSLEELEKMEGIGKSIAAKIQEIQKTGTTQELQQLLDATPSGIVDMMGIKGLGPKKIRQLWKELDIESTGELLYACYENRLLDLKGFGPKTQESVKQSIEFKLNNSGKHHYASVEKWALRLVEALQKKLGTPLVSLSGAMLRKEEIVEGISIVVVADAAPDMGALEKEMNLPVTYICTTPEDYYYHLVESSATEAHKEGIGFGNLTTKSFESETALYAALDLPYIAPELREGLFELEKARAHQLPELIVPGDLKGILHNHSTYSDGMNTLEEMALYCKELGYEYLGMCDHSQSAFYANGLKPEQVLEQQAEIDRLNERLGPFRVFKGIESDILNDGSLDYTEDILKTFDFVVASVHSNLKMNEEKATQRLIRAIENPYTRILGHPTGRLLLARPGYPIDHRKVIDACAANGVSIELNAHPYRLDIDWRWIPYCLEKGVFISINPDAHAKAGYHDMYYGVCVARKGLLSKEHCLNAKSRVEFEAWLSKK